MTFDYPTVSFTRFTTNDRIVQFIRESTHGDVSFDSTKRIIHALSFHEIVFDPQLASAVKRFFRSISSDDLGICEPNQRSLAKHLRDNQEWNGPRVLREFNVISCPGNSHLEEVLRVAMEMDVVQHYKIKGDNNFSFEQDRPQNHAEQHQQQPHRRIRRWMSIPPSERPLDSENYAQPSLQPFAGIEQNSCSTTSTNRNNLHKANKNIREFSLSCFRLSSEDMKLLRIGILSPTSSNLEVLSFSNVAFLDDGSVQELAGAVAALSQFELQSQTQNDCNARDPSTETSTTESIDERRLTELNLVRCNLSDDQLELIVRSLMEARTDISGTAVPIAAPVTVRSSLRKFDISFNACGEKALEGLGDWLVNHLDLKSKSNVLCCSCSLECLKISNSIESANEREDENSDHNRTSSMLRYLTHPMLKIINSGNDDEIDHDSNKTYINRTLKKLWLNGNPRLGGRDVDGVNDMGYLGLFVSRYLSVLEELDLDSCGISDAGLAKFATASCLESPSSYLVTTRPENAREVQMSPAPIEAGSLEALVVPNTSLRRLRLSGNDKLSSKSSSSVVKILDRYPMLKTITFDSRKQCVWKGTVHEHRVRHLLNVNECGRVLLFSLRNSNDKHRHNHSRGESIAMTLWPLVFEYINRRFLHGLGILNQDSRMLAANGIYFLIRNNAAIIPRQSSSGAVGMSTEASAPLGSQETNDQNVEQHAERLPLHEKETVDKRQSHNTTTKRKRCNRVDKDDEPECRQLKQFFHDTKTE